MEACVVLYVLGGGYVRNYVEHDVVNNENVLIILTCWTILDIYSLYYYNRIININNIDNQNNNLIIYNNNPNVY